LEYAAKQLIEKNDFQGGGNKNESIEQGAVFGERHAEEMRILTRGDYITAREIFDTAK